MALLSHLVRERLGHIPSFHLSLHESSGSRHAPGHDLTCLIRRPSLRSASGFKFCRSSARDELLRLGILRAWNNFMCFSMSIGELGWMDGVKGPRLASSVS